MSDRILKLFYSYFLIPGIITGISFKTGVDVSEIGIASMILKSFCKALQTPTCAINPFLTVVGVILTAIPFLYLISTGNILGLIAGISFFMSGFLLALESEIGVFLLLFSVLMVLLFSREGEL